MNQKRILIVEDEEFLLKLVTILLTSKGYTVEGAMDGPLALELVTSMKPDLILLDIAIPGIDGLEVCRQVKSNEATHNIPVILFTADKNKKTFGLGEQAGADWHLTKPFKSTLLIETIQKFLS
jgi:twitching motility two-component system response regulator PilG